MITKKNENVKMFHFDIITESTARTDKKTYENDDFFVCWNNQYNHYENDTIDIYRKPITKKTLFSISINSKDGTVSAQEVFLSEYYCIVRIDEETEHELRQYINIYELLKGTHIATFSLELRGYPRFFAANQTCYMFGKSSCCIQKFHENNTKVPFLNRNVPVQCFQEHETWYHDKSMQYFRSNIYYTSPRLVSQDSSSLSSITMYKNNVFVQKKLVWSNVVITDVFSVSNQQIKQLFSQRGSVFHSNNKAIFHFEHKITIRDINNFDHVHVYELNMAYILNNYPLSVYEVHKKEAYSQSYELNRLNDVNRSYRTLYNNRDHMNVDSIHVFDKFGVIIKVSFYDGNVAVYAIVNLNTKNILCVNIPYVMDNLGVEVIQIGFQTLLITSSQILAWINQNLHELVKTRAKLQMYRAERLVCQLNDSHDTFSLV